MAGKTRIFEYPAFKHTVRKLWASCVDHELLQECISETYQYWKSTFGQDRKTFFASLSFCINVVGPMGKLSPGKQAIPREGHWVAEKSETKSKTKLISNNFDNSLWHDLKHSDKDSNAKLEKAAATLELMLGLGLALLLAARVYIDYDKRGLISE